MGDYTDKLAILRAFFLKLHLPVTLRKKRMVAADADVDARMKSSAALPHQDVARNDLLTAIHFDAKSFGL